MKKPTLLAAVLSMLLIPSLARAQTVIFPDLPTQFSAVMQAVGAAQKKAAAERAEKDRWMKVLQEHQEALRQLHKKVDPAVLEVDDAIGEGSAFIIDRSGLAMTAYHVVGDADEVTVKSDHVSPLKAKVVARAPERDIALLQIDGDKKDWPALSFGDYSKVKPADPVYSFGNALNLGIGIKNGLVQRCENNQINPYAGCAQTTTGLDPGDSGGPMVNIRGEVVGMNDAIPARARNISFSIKGDLLQQAVKEYKKTGELADYGIEATYRMISTDNGVALMIHSAPKGSPLRAFDIIEAVDGADLASDDSAFSAFKKKMAQKGQGAKVTLRIRHQDPQPNGTIKQHDPEEIQVPLAKLSQKQGLYTPPPPHGFIFGFPGN